MCGVKPSPGVRGRGHRVVAANGEDMGGLQAIELMPDGVLRGASDHRKDGEAVGW